MRNVVFLLLLTEKLFGQSCGGEYPSGFYHNHQFITVHGDTMNKLNSNELYDGLHLYADNANNLFGDTNSFLIGNYQNGLPVGEWKDHCKDGSFSLGTYSCGGGKLNSKKENLAWKKFGIYQKVGVWKYFDNDSNLISTFRYDRQVLKHGWINETYKADSAGKFILIKYESKFHYSTWRRKETTKLFTDNGEPRSAYYNNLWRYVYYEFYLDGKVRSKEKTSHRFLDLRCKHRKRHTMVNYRW